MVTALVLAGFLGAAIIIVAFFANQQGWLASADWRFPAANLAGSVLMMGSLVVQWNAPSVAIEGFWMAISAYGLVRSLRP